MLPQLITLVLLAFLSLQATARKNWLSRYRYTTSVDAMGTGCPAGTVEVYNGSDSSLSLSFADFLGNTEGLSTTGSYAPKHCQLTLGVDVTSGYQFAFNQVVLGASFNVSAGVELHSSASYYFQSAGSNPSGVEKSAGSATSHLSGGGLFRADLVNELSPILWSPCGKSYTPTTLLVQVVIDIELWVAVIDLSGGTGNSTGFRKAGIDLRFPVPSNEVSAQYGEVGIEWRKC